MFHAVNQAVTTRRVASSLMSTHVKWSALFWSILPGLGHIRTGHRVFGRLFMGIWLALLVVMLAHAGSQSAWFWYLLVVGFHCFVVTLLLSEALQRQPVLRRLLVGALVYGTLTFGLYLPARWLAQRFVVPLQISGIRSSDILKDGDTILYTGSWLRPSSWNRGDLVFYRVHQTSGHGFLIQEGFGLDRIVATGGDVVEVRDGRLLVNGQETPHEMWPLRGLNAIPNGFKTQIPPDCFLIFPSALSLGGGHGNYEAYLSRLVEGVGVLQETDILGKVWWRLRPISRLGPLE